MTKRLLLPLVCLSLLLALALTNCSGAKTPQDYPAPDRSRMLTAEEVASDAQWLVGMIEDVHPIFLNIDAYAHLPSETYTQAKEALLAHASSPMSVQDFYLLCCRYTASLGDCHTGITAIGGAGLLPLSFYWNENGLYILDENDSQSKGEQVLTIGGVDVEAIGQVIDAHIAHENEPGRFFNRSNNVRSKTIHLAAGCLSGDSISLDVLLPSGDIEPRNIPYDMASMQSSSVKSFTYGLIEDGTIILITSNTFIEDDDAIAAATFLEAELSKGIQKVIFDVRQNTGGNSRVWDAFAHILGQDGPHDGRFGVIRRFSDLAKSTVFAGANAQGAYDQFAPIYSPVLNSQLQLVMLTTERTYSSGVLAMTWAKDILRATIIGRTPRNVVNHFGNPVQYTMPASHLRGYISSWQVFRPLPAPYPNNGAMVDIEVPFPEDILEYAVQYLQKSEAR